MEEQAKFSVELTESQWVNLLSLADRGMASVVAALTQQAGQAGDIAKISSLAAEIIGEVQRQIKDKK